MPGACACSTFSPTATFCVQGACSPQFLDPVVDMVSLACPPAIPNTSTSSSSRSQTTSSSSLSSSPIRTTASTTISGGNFRTTATDAAPSPTITSQVGPYGGNNIGNSTYSGGSNGCLYQTSAGASGQSTCWVQVGINAATVRRPSAALLTFSLGLCQFLARIMV